MNSYTGSAEMMRCADDHPDDRGDRRPTAPDLGFGVVVSFHPLKDKSRVCLITDGELRATFRGTDQVEYGCALHSAIAKWRAGHLERTAREMFQHDKRLRNVDGEIMLTAEQIEDILTNGVANA